MSHETRDYIAILHKNGYRVTPQRLIVLDAVCELEGHVTLAQVYARVVDLDPTIDRSTVYRALHVLVGVGLVTATELGEAGRVYSITGEAQHHHLICLACGKTFTVPAGEVQPLLQHFRESYGFEVQADHLAFKGLCAACSAQAD